MTATSRLRLKSNRRFSFLTTVALRSRWWGMSSGCERKDRVLLGSKGWTQIRGVVPGVARVSLAVMPRGFTKGKEIKEKGGSCMCI